MKLASLILCLLIGSAALAASPDPGGLSISVVPSSPVAIPFGSTTVLGAQVTAPYFLINSLNLTWTGHANLGVLAVLMTNQAVRTNSNDPVINCGIAGDQLAASFASYNSNGNVIIPAGVTAISGPLPCEGFALPNPMPATLSIPVTVMVYGVVLDATGNAIGEEIAEAQVTVQ